MTLACWPRVCVLALFAIATTAGAGETSEPGPSTSTSAQSAACAAMLAVPNAPTTMASILRADVTSSLDAARPIAAAPVELLVALSLSGGGYRAMLFHVGTLRRLNDAGLLARLSVVSSVSGGSVVSAYLAYRWRDLTFDDAGRATNFVDVVELPLRELASSTLDIPSVLTGLLPFTSAADRQVAHFDERLFRGAPLSAIAPGGGERSDASRPRPLFIINATSLQTGELWQFRAKVMGGPIIGWTMTDGVRLAQATAASSGFPPFLSPLVLMPSSAADGISARACGRRRAVP